MSNPWFLSVLSLWRDASLFSLQILDWKAEKDLVELVGGVRVLELREHLLEQSLQLVVSDVFDLVCFVKKLMMAPLHNHNLQSLQALFFVLEEFYGI